MKKSRKKSSGGDVLPKIFRKPLIAGGISLAADIALLVAAAVLNAIRARFEVSCYLTESGVSETSPYGFFGIAAVVCVIIAAGAAAVIISAAVLNGKKAAAAICASAGLLALSGGAAWFSSYIVNGEKPRSAEFVSFSDESRTLILAEEQYDGTNLLKIYLTDPDAEKGDEVTRLVCTELKVLTESGGFEDRYTLTSISEDMVQIGFADGDSSYRTIQVSLTDNSED
jgi:hypothetical protein